MKLLTDIGNSQIKIAQNDNQKLLKIKSFSIEDIEKFRKYITIPHCHKRLSRFKLSF